MLTVKQNIFDRYFDSFLNREKNKGVIFFICFLTTIPVLLNFNQLKNESMYMLQALAVEGMPIDIGSMATVGVITAAILKPIIAWISYLIFMFVTYGVVKIDAKNAGDIDINMYGISRICTGAYTISVAFTIIDGIIAFFSKNLQFSLSLYSILGSKIVGNNILVIICQNLSVGNAVMYVALWFGIRKLTKYSAFSATLCTVIIFVVTVFIGMIPQLSAYLV